jgi:thiamine biosynthesis lipoprotein
MLAVFSSCLLLLGPSAAGAPLGETRLVMGTTAAVRVSGLREAAPALDAAFAALQRVDDAMSLWKPSELSGLNERGFGRVSEDLLAVLRGALEAAAASDGAFDPTVEPLVRATGGLGGPRRGLEKSERRELLKRVGWRRVHLDPATSAVRLEPGTRLDLGGIAKGYAVDLALAELRRAGASAGEVDLGSSSLGAFGVDTRVAVRDPEAAGGEPWASFRLAGGFLATSGSDQKGHHILDPRTGRTVAGVLSATVVAPTGLQADALSTAVFVMGADEGLALLERQGAAGLVLLRDHGRRLVRATRGFAPTYGLVTAPGVEAR